MKLYKNAGHLLVVLSLSSLLLSLILSSCVTSSEPAGPSPSSNLSINTQQPVSANTTSTQSLEIKSFQAQPKRIKPGEKTVMTWNVSGASVITIEPDVGKISGNNSSTVVAPQGTTLYTLKATDGLHNTQARFLVIVATPQGEIIWPSAATENKTLPYDDWVYYPNKYVSWVISDVYKAPYSDLDTCQYIGSITNNHNEWTMIDISINNIVVLDFVSPGDKRLYTRSADCKYLVLKWKWKVNK